MKIKVKNHLEYNEIAEYIYIGTRICCQRHFDYLTKKVGIIADIDLEEKKLDRPLGVKAYMWLPVVDYTAPSQAQLLIGAHFIQDLVNHRMKVYVHCKAGEGRSPTLVAAYFILKGLSVKEAIAKIKKKRHKASPNKSQIQALEKFSKAIK